MPRKKSAGRRFLGKPVSRDPDDAPELLDDFFKYGDVRDGERRSGGAGRRLARSPNSR